MFHEDKMRKTRGKPCRQKKVPENYHDRALCVHQQMKLGGREKENVHIRILARIT
jgi:hypothetical protein